VQVDPVNPKLKAPGTNKRLKLKYDNTLSIFNFAFNFNLRRYIVGRAREHGGGGERAAVRRRVAAAW
jgi:hypothetical protein